jgi:hypothetical protein
VTNSGVGATGAVSTAAVWVVSALLAVLTVNACAVGTALDSVTDADGFATVATTSTTPTEVGAVVALTVAEYVESDPVLAGVNVVCSVSAAGDVLDGVGTGVSAVGVL